MPRLMLEFDRPDRQTTGQIHTLEQPLPEPLSIRSAVDVVIASLRGLELGEIVCARGVEQADLLQAVFEAELAAFDAQSPELAQRYQIPSSAPAQ